MDACLKELLIHTINIRRVTGWSASGANMTLGAATPVLAYVEEERRVTTEPNGNQVTTTHIIITEDEILRDDLIWLPGLDPNDLNLARKVQDVARYYDPFTSGTVDHYETVI